MRNLLICVLLFWGALLGTIASAQSQDVADSVAPELATGVTQKALVKARNMMVTTANPHASKAGFSVLKQGGNAIDAMVTIQLVLGLVEPQSSGLGGGAFLVYYDAEEEKLTTFDGRETAPAATTADMFLDENGQPLRFFEAVVGGKSVGTPGTVKLLHEVHKRHGKLAWENLFDEAIRLSEQGFTVSPRLNQLITYSAESLFRFEPTRDYFLSEEASPSLGKPTVVDGGFYNTQLIIVHTFLFIQASPQSRTTSSSARTASTTSTSGRPGPSGAPTRRPWPPVGVSGPNWWCSTALKPWRSLEIMPVSGSRNLSCMFGLGSSQQYCKMDTFQNYTENLTFIDCLLTLRVNLPTAILSEIICKAK